MNCRSAEPLFSALIEDELSQKERRDLEAHLLGCRRCSAGVRELRATLALLRSVPVSEASPHFEEDVFARVRSGEALRPSVPEWVSGLLAPPKLRPIMAAGAGICAIAFAVVLVAHPPVTGTRGHEPLVVAAPGVSAPSQPAAPSPVAPAQSGSLASAGGPGPPAPIVGARSVTELAGIVAGARTPAAADSAGRPDQPETGYQDEYITDQFLLERAPASGDPSMVPASGSQNDDVYIIF